MNMLDAYLAGPSDLRAARDTKECAPRGWSESAQPGESFYNS